MSSFVSVSRHSGTWQVLPALSGVPYLSRLYLAMGGVLLLASALLPLPYLVRGAMGLVLGCFPLAISMVDCTWREALTVWSIFLLGMGLFHRWNYRASVLARQRLAALGQLTLTRE